jgi:hypothetical protein
MYSEMKSYKNIKFDNYEKVKQDGDSERVEAKDVYQDAQVISSEIKDAIWDDDGHHFIALDIDMPVIAVPSSTPHHTHLYIPRAVSWEQYVKFIEACVDIGIVQPGYLEASKKRQATFLRLPWIKKGMENLHSIDQIEEFLEGEDEAS